MWIHIADPTRWVASPHSPLAEEAAQRSKSVYLPTGAPALAGPDCCRTLAPAPSQQQALSRRPNARAGCALGLGFRV